MTNTNSHNVSLWNAGNSDDDRIYQDTTIAIVMFNINRRSTLAYAEGCIKKIRSICGEIPVAVMANKCDLFLGKVITHDEILEFSDRLNVKVIRTSAITGKGVDETIAFLFA